MQNSAQLTKYRAHLQLLPAQNKESRPEVGGFSGFMDQAGLVEALVIVHQNLGNFRA